MKAIDFEGSTHIYYANKMDHSSMPYQRKDGLAISCYSLTWKERIKILLGANVWVAVLNNPMSPQKLSLEKPL